jgi:curli biogenesis system outer membrane secretion channel CsgG
MVLVISAGSGEQKKPTCAVTGFLNEVSNEQWRDARVGMGVRAMLTQSVSETGLFSLLEEKEEVKVKLASLRTEAWMNKKGKKHLEEVDAFLKKEGAEFTAQGRIYYFGKPRSKASVGPVHLASDEVVIKIEVMLTDTKKGKKISALGTGKAKTSVKSALFTFHQEKLDADKSMVATATKKAIDEAVTEVAKKYRKKYRIP